MTTEKYNQNKEIKMKYLFAFISICGVLFGFHYIINRVLQLSNLVSLFFLTPLILMVVPFLIAKYQVESNIFNQNKIEKKISSLSMPTMIIILLLTVMILFLSCTYSIVSFFIEDRIIIGSCITIVGLLASYFLLYIAKYFYEKIVINIKT